MVYEIVDNGCEVVRVVGSIDLSNVDELEAALDSAASASPKGFVIDLSEVAYMDSAAIKAILVAYQKVSEAEGKLSTVIRSKSIRGLFDLIQISTLPGLFISEDIEAARQALAQQ